MDSRREEILEKNERNLIVPVKKYRFNNCNNEHSIIIVWSVSALLKNNPSYLDLPYRSHPNTICDIETPSFIVVTNLVTETQLDWLLIPT